MSDGGIDEKIVEDLMNLVGVGLGVASVFAVSSLMISSAHAQTERFAATAEHNNQQASLDLATTAECVTQILAPTRAKAPEKPETLTLWGVGSGPLAVT